jgi:iron complex outermembrane receptor protein
MRHESGFRLQLLLGSAFLATLTSPAFAQGQPSSRTEDAVDESGPPAGPEEQLASTADQPAESAGDASPGGLDDIVVTATKRETNLQTTPIAISVVDAQIVRDRHVQSLYDLADGAVPSLRIATFEARQSALTVGIRGIVPFDANQTARDQGVGVYIDGVYLGRQQGLNAALFDVARIEVLRGPQGTLFGRNSEGGAVSIVTKVPTGEFGGRVVAGVGNFGQYNGELHLDLPAVANVAVKLDALIQHQDATLDNPLAGQTGWNFYNRIGGRVSARWTPFDGFTADLSFDSGKDENTPFYSQLLNYNPLGRTVGVYDPTTNRLVAPGSPAGAATCTSCIAPLSPLVVVSGDRRMNAADIGVPQQPSVDRSSGFTGILKYKVLPELELRSITAWRKVSTRQWDNSGGAHRTIFAPNANFSRYSLSELFQHQFSQEFQAVGRIPHVDYVAGFYYFNEDVSEAAATPSSNRWNATGTGYTINSPIVFGTITSANQGWDRSSWFVQRDSHATADSYAAFGQFTWTPAGLEIFHLTAGARYTHDSRDGVLTMVQNKPTNFIFHYSRGRIDPLVTAALDVSRDVHVYAKYATGFRAGGANDRSQTFTAFGPESVQSYEVGAKIDFLDHRARLNVAAYLMNRKGTQTDFDNVDTNPASPTFNLHTEETRNAPGISKIRGIEADLTVRPVDNLTLGASYAYTYTKVPPTPNPFLPGNPLLQVFVVFTPRHAASGFVDYQLPAGFGEARFRLHLDANYAGSQYSFQAEPVKTDSSFIVNGRVALAEIPMNDSGITATVALWGRNLLNETHIYRRSAANAAILGDYGNFNPPRTFGIEGIVDF